MLTLHIKQKIAAALLIALSWQYDFHFQASLAESVPVAQTESLRLSDSEKTFHSSQPQSSQYEVTIDTKIPKFQSSDDNIFEVLSCCFDLGVLFIVALAGIAAVLVGNWIIALTEANY